MIVIPMAGLSSRFTKAGYDKPKYMLPLDGKSVFWHSLMSFQKYFESEKFLFVAREIQDTASFLEEEIKNLGIRSYQVIMLDQPTAGQAETVELGLKMAEVPEGESLTIFNIDSFRKDFSYPSDKWFEKTDGYLEVFKGGGDNWSYVEPCENSADPVVKRTTEKDPISDLCSNGLYYFRYIKDFHWALNKERGSPTCGELYIAPLYNHLINANQIINYNLIEMNKTIFCGTPQEYLFLDGKGV